MSAELSSGHQAHDERNALIERRERLLDDALAESFPASDPPSFGRASDWSACLDKGNGSSILRCMSERSQFGPPELHPGSSTARL